MTLDPTLTLLATLAGAVIANQPEVHVSYDVYNKQGDTAKPAPFRTALDNTSDVTILAAPPAESSYKVTGLHVYNKDTANATVTLKTTDGTTQRIICRVVLSTLESLHFSEDADTWTVLTASGAAKGNSGISGPASSTNNAVPRWNGTSATIVQDSGVTIDGSNNVVIPGTGPHAIGGATDASSELIITGTFAGSSLARALLVNSTLTPAANGAGSGIQVAPTINKASSGTHADFASLRVEPPTIGAGAATLTNAATLKVTDAPSVGTNKYDLWAASTTAGAHRFDGGTTGAQTATFAATNKPGVGTTSPDTWLPVTIDGTLHYIPAFL